MTRHCLYALAATGLFFMILADGLMPALAGGHPECAKGTCYCGNRCTRCQLCGVRNDSGQKPTNR